MSEGMYPGPQEFKSSFEADEELSPFAPTPEQIAQIAADVEARTAQEKAAAELADQSHNNENRVTVVDYGNRDQSIPEATWQMKRNALGTPYEEVAPGRFMNTSEASNADKKDPEEHES